MALKVSQINIYPLKSAAQISLDSSVLTRVGLVNDRRLMLVDEAGVCISARQFPNLLCVYTQINQQAYHFTYIADSISVRANVASSKKMKINVDGSMCLGRLVSADADKWFSNILGINCQLIRSMDDDVRNSYINADADSSDFAVVTDRYALLLIGEASLADLNQRLDSPVGMRNFRPNLVINGAAAYEEDGWDRIRIGENEFKVTEMCQRCKLTTIHPDTAKAREDREPLKTLMKYRRGESGRGVIFGVYLAPVGNLGSIHLDDEVTLL